MKVVVPSDPKIIGMLLFAFVLAGGLASRPAIEALEPEHRPGIRERLEDALDGLRGLGGPSFDERKVRSLALLPIPS